MSDRTQDLKNLRAVATACKNYVDETKEQILWQVGQYDISTQDDNTTAYQKIVPTGATRCKLKSIGGMSYKSNNLANNPTITSNATNDFQIFILLDNLNLPAGTYTLSFKNVNTLNSGTRYYMEAVPNMNYAYTGAVSTKTDYSITFTTTAVITTRLTVRLQYTSGGDTGTTTNVMLNSGSTALPYEPYFENIRDNAVTSVKSYGANLFNIHTTDTYPYQYESWNSQPVRGNATNTYVENDTINCNSRVGTISYLGFKVNFTRTGTYIVAFDKDNTNRSCFSILNKTDMAMVLYREAITTSGRVTVTFTISDLTKDYYLGFTNYSSNSILSNIMLNYGSTALPYKPYRGLIDTFTIPDEIQSLTGYGRGINENCYNILDLESNVFTDKDNLVDLGTLDYNYGETSATPGFNTPKPTDAKSNSLNGLCSIYDVEANWWNTPDNYFKIYIGTNNINVGDSRYTDTTIYKTAMNGINFQYELETYNITDNLELPNNVIEVEEGGYLVFENPYGQAVPSNITYRIEVAK